MKQQKQCVKLNEHKTCPVNYIFKRCHCYLFTFALAALSAAPKRKKYESVYIPIRHGCEAALRQCSARAMHAFIHTVCN